MSDHCVGQEGIVLGPFHPEISSEVSELNDNVHNPEGGEVEDAPSHAGWLGQSEQAQEAHSEVPGGETIVDLVIVIFLWEVFVAHSASCQVSEVHLCEDPLGIEVGEEGLVEEVEEPDPAPDAGERGELACHWSRGRLKICTF